VTEPVPIRDAATVMLVRDADDGPEVFMLRRSLGASFVGGAYVFPGGAVDPHDRTSEAEAICDGLTDVAASRRLGLAAGGIAYWVAAIRECFEEAGVLLARSAAGQVVRFDEPAVEARFETHRRAVHDGERRLVEVCVEEDLRLITDDIHYVSHWITPVGEPRRFDTRFFVARAPEAQTPLHDDRETIESLWIRPADALARQAAGELFMIPPTIANLRFLEPHDSAAKILAAAGEIADVPAIQPKLRVDPDGKVVGILLPGQPGFDDLP
jgi:8-oxo-dGTP pyrophosphatase MutT (NUDIX family)